MRNSYKIQQSALIDQIENQSRSLIKAVSYRDDYAQDPALCLTAVAFLDSQIGQHIQEEVLNPLKQIEPQHHYYEPDAMHITLKNIRRIQDPPNYTIQEIKTITRLFNEIVPPLPAVDFEISRLVRFPTSLVMIGFTDHVLFNVISTLRQGLDQANIMENQVYVSDDVYFGNVSICRFVEPPGKAFLEQVKALRHVVDELFCAERLDLITCNAACTPASTKVWGSYQLQGER